MIEPGSAVLCNHANEVPHTCSCYSDCYCRVKGVCKNRFQQPIDQPIYSDSVICVPHPLELPYIFGGRIDFDTYMMAIALLVSTRGTCDRAKVGAVATKNRIILATGYNGAPRGVKHCVDVGHDMVDGHCTRASHAEANLVAHAAFAGVSLAGATVYCTHSTCRACANVLINVGISEVVYLKKYNLGAVLPILDEASVSHRNLEKFVFPEIPQVEDYISRR